MKKTFLLFSALIASCSLVNAQVKFNQDSIAALAAKLEVWVNVPLVTPGTSNAEAPSDAIVLYNGNGLGAFQKKMVALLDGNWMQMELLQILKGVVI